MARQQLILKTIYIEIDIVDKHTCVPDLIIKDIFTFIVHV